MLLDTEPDPAYDQLTSFAADIFDVPIALVSLVDEKRQWFKARVGLDVQETARDVAFCDHAIRVPHRTLVIPDAREDDRFRDNPLVIGEPHIVFYAGAPIHDVWGHALGTLCLIDYRPRVMSEMDLQRLRILADQVNRLVELRTACHDHELALDRVEEANQDLAEFARVAAHDLRAPLRRIATYVGFLTEDIGETLPQESQEHLAELASTTDLMSDLLESITQLAQSAHLELKAEPVDLQATLANAIVLITGDENFEGVRVEGELPTVRGDARAYLQIMQNLISNALKFRREDGGPTVVRMRRKGGRVFIEVQDQGIGMAPDDLRSIFVPFKRLNSGHEYPGSGIGLSIVQRLVERQRGVLSVDSELGTGSTLGFSVITET